MNIDLNWENWNVEDANQPGQQMGDLDLYLPADNEDIEEPVLSD